MATVSPVSFGLVVPKYAPKSHQTNNSTPVAAKSTATTSTSEGVVPNQKSAIAVLLTSAMLCTVAIANLIKAGR